MTLFLIFKYLTLTVISYLTVKTFTKMRGKILLILQNLLEKMLRPEYFSNRFKKLTLYLTIYPIIPTNCLILFTPFLIITIVTVTLFDILFLISEFITCYLVSSETYSYSL